MRDIHRARTLADAYMIRDVLQREGVPAVIRNEHLVGAVGDVPTVEAMPTVSVADLDVQRALFLLQEYLRDDDAAEALDEMDRDSAAPADGEAAHAAMTELFVAAKRLSRNGRHGSSLDEIARHGDYVASSAAPFGVPAKAWEAIGRLAQQTVQAAASGVDEEVQSRATALRDAVTPFV